MYNQVQRPTCSSLRLHPDALHLTLCTFNINNIIYFPLLIFYNNQLKSLWNLDAFHDIIYLKLRCCRDWIKRRKCYVLIYLGGIQDSWILSGYDTLNELNTCRHFSEFCVAINKFTRKYVFDTRFRVCLLVNF